MAVNSIRWGFFVALAFIRYYNNGHPKVEKAE
jgi:hypothetical protein